LHVSVPFAAQHRARPQLRVTAARVDRTPSCVLGRYRLVEQALALRIQVTQLIGLKPVSQNAEQEVAGQVRGRRSPERVLPPDPKFTNVEITQARNLDVE
jgi:hypothetical protein